MRAESLGGRRIGKPTGFWYRNLEVRILRAQRTKQQHRQWAVVCWPASRVLAPAYAGSSPARPAQHDQEGEPDGRCRARLLGDAGSTAWSSNDPLSAHSHQAGPDPGGRKTIGSRFTMYPQAHRRLLPEVSPDPQWREKLEAARLAAGTIGDAVRPTRAKRERDIWDGR